MIIEFNSIKTEIAGFKNTMTQILKFIKSENFYISLRKII